MSVCDSLSIVSTVMEIVLQLAKRSIVSISFFEMFMKGYETSPIESHSAFAQLSRLYSGSLYGFTLRLEY